MSQVHGEVNSADASGGVAFLLYDANQGLFALPPGSRLNITDLDVISAAGGAMHVRCGTAAAGHYVARGTLAAGGGFVRSYKQPYVCPPGSVPILVSPAGQVDAVLHGFITPA
jgi:hypothetical protein